MVDIEDAELAGFYYQARSVDAHAVVAVREEFLNQFCLSLLQTLYAERHSAQVGNLLLGIAQRKMAKETLVVLINLIIHQSLLTHQLAVYAPLETVYYLLKDRLVEHQFLAAHTARHIATCKEFATLQDDAVAARIEHIYPEFFVQNFSRKDEYLHVRILLLGLTADFYAYRGRTAQTQVEQNQVRQLLLDEFPIGYFALGSTDDFSLGNIVFKDSLCALQFQGHVFYYDDFKIFHCLIFLFSYDFKLSHLIRAGSKASILRQPFSPLQALMPQPRRLVTSPSSLTICRQSR